MKHFLPAQQLLAVLAALLLTVSSCKKDKFLADCPEYTNSSVAELVMYLNGCDKVWEACYDDGKSYNSTRPLYKFGNMPEGKMMLYRLQGGNAWFHHSFFDYRIEEQNGEVVLKISKFDETRFPTPYDVDSVYTYKIDIRDKAFFTMTTIGTPVGEESRMGNKLYRKAYSDDLPSDFNTPTNAPDPNNNGGGGGNGGCNGSYNGPNNDIQIDSHCMQAYDLICNQGYSKSSSQVQSVCATYRGMVDCCAPSTPSPYPSCPYCD